MNDEDLTRLFHDVSSPVRPRPGRAAAIAASAGRRRAYTVASASAVVVVIIATFAVLRSTDRGSVAQTPPPVATVSPRPRPVAVTTRPVTPSPAATVTSRPQPSAATTGPASWRIAYGQDSTSPDAGIEVRDGNGRLLHHVPDKAGYGIALSPDGQLLAYVSNASGVPDLVVMHSDSASVLATLSMSAGPSLADFGLAVAPDDNRLALADDKGLLLWTLHPRKASRLLTVTGSGSGVSWLTWAPDGRSLAFITFGTGVHIPGGAALAADTVYRWDGTFHRMSAGGHALALAWSAAGQLAFLSADGSVRVATGTPRVAASLPAVNRYTTSASLSWSPDSTHLAVVAGTLKLIDVATHSVHTVPQPGSDDRVAWLPDGTLLVAGFATPHPDEAAAPGAPKVYDQTGRLLRRFPTTLDPDWQFAFGAPQN